MNKDQRKKSGRDRRRLAVVTGASSGIGMEFAKQLAGEGFSLVLVARREEKLHKLGRELQEHYGIHSRVIAADLSSEDACRRLMRKLTGERITVFINGAGFGDCGFFPETSLLKELSMIDVNVRAVHLLTKLVVRQMEEQGSGYLLNVASSAGLFHAGPFMSTYYATKSYVTSLTEGIAEELRQRHSRVYVGCLCPGPVETNFDQVANVDFSLEGISAQECVRYAIEEMKKRKIVIVPTVLMKLAVVCNRWIPRKISVRVVARQQKKKLKA